MKKDAKAKQEETTQEKSKETNVPENGQSPDQQYLNIANNTLIFLDQIKVSAVGDDNRQKFQAMIQCSQLLEAITQGHLVIVRPDQVKK